MSKLIMIDELKAEAANGMYRTPQGVMEFLSETRRSVQALTGRMEQINKGNRVDVHLAMDEALTSMVVRVESSG